jgi:nucleoside-diphosphate-sugar epimerase
VSGKRALVVGVSGITGYNAARHLIDQGWDVDGISRRAPEGLDGLGHISVDVRDAAAVPGALRRGDYTHVFYCTWMRMPTEAENCEVNSTMLRNVLEPLVAAGTLEHVALVTGLKHYLGPFEAYAKAPADTPFREDQERLEYQNFYYDQEDVLFEAAERGGFSWSVHRAHTVIGWALGNVMNMGVTLAVYGSICRELGKPFVFPGSPQQYNGVTDMTDATLLAEQLAWAATSPSAANQALNIVNGDVFRWRRMWGVVGDALGVEVGEYPGEPRSLEGEMEGQDRVWDEIVTKHGLRPSRLTELASWWHTDSDLGREVETFADMTKSRMLGFSGFRRTEDTFRSLFQRLREARVIPS